MPAQVNTSHVVNVNNQGFFLRKKTINGAVKTSNITGDQNFIQRKCAHCEEEQKAQRKPLLSFIQKKETGNNSIASDSISNQIQSTKNDGNPISATTKSFMESRFGKDFSNVKIHTGSYGETERFLLISKQVWLMQTLEAVIL